MDAMMAHDALLAEVAGELKQMEFEVCGFGVENTLPVSMRSALRSCDHPAAAYIRRQPDLLVCHPEANVAFFVELKTTNRAEGSVAINNDCLARARNENEQGRRTLFVLRDLANDRSCGFWVTEEDLPGCFLKAETYSVMNWPEDRPAWQTLAAQTVSVFTDFDGNPVVAECCCD